MVFIKRAEIFVPTLLGWFVVVSLVFAAAVSMSLLLYPFLSVSRPIGGDYLVVEGWLSRESMTKLLSKSANDDYRGIFVTGGPLHSDSYVKQLYPSLHTWAEVGAKQLNDTEQLEIPITAVPSGRVVKDRTYASALALRAYFQAKSLQNLSVDLLTSGPHARRSWLLYSMALENVGVVGVLTVDPIDYDGETWWSNSAGVKEVVGELLAYCYAKFLFYPKSPESGVSRPATTS